MIKNKNFSLFVLLFSIFWVQCKNTKGGPNDVFAKKDTAGVNANKFKIVPLNGVLPDTPIRSSFDDPIAVSNNKYSHFDEILMKDLCNKFWKFDGGIDGAKNITEMELDGFWLQFFENGKYEKGEFSKITSKGSYTVDHQGFIEMSPAKGSEKKSEWQSKFNNDMLILVGTPKYADNQIQMRLSRIAKKPVRPTN